MEQRADAPALEANRPAQHDRERQRGTLLGWYTTEHGRRHLRAIETGDCGLCLIDEGADASFLVEPLLEEMAEARAIAADYLALASEQRQPQTRHPWPRDDERSRS
jgi:hypothetical protein